MNEPKPLPWQELMAFGFGKLHLSPVVFWSMTLPEMAAALRWYSGQADTRPTHNDLSALMARFPDQSTDNR